MQILLVIILLKLIVAQAQINLYLTDQISGNEMQHDCLRVATTFDQSNANRQMMSYCIRESRSKYDKKIDHHVPKFTFAELSKRNVTSQDLYLWSAPIDRIENYQFYLNQLPTSDGRALENTVFYNCTLPRFGSMCEYEFDDDHSSLSRIIRDFYHSNEYNPTDLTCYVHLQCDRGPSPSCLDWSEICDGKIDCLDGGSDEEHCWQLEINECQADEYRCTNGQCIPRTFYLDDRKTPDCLDQSDERRQRLYLNEQCTNAEPFFACADITCADMPLTSSCLTQRTKLLVEALFSVKDDNVSDECWTAWKCVLDMPNSMDPSCANLCRNQAYISTINQKCPEMVFIPAVPVLFGDVYYTYTKNDSQYLDCGIFWPPYQCFETTRYDEFFINSSKIVYNGRSCYRSKDFPSTGFILIQWINAYLIPSYISLKKYTSLSTYTSEICNRSSMYQCIHSPKCISIYRLLDGFDDCPRNDDEDMTEINHLEQLNRDSFRCQMSNKSIPLSTIEDSKCDCGYNDHGWCEDEHLNVNYIKRNISFTTICDRYTELIPILIDQQNETDETGCEQWICNNIYTHCDGLWNCPNGEDEIGCYSLPSLNCSFDEHPCVSNLNSELTCLPLRKANDGHIDCLGATDEPDLCMKSTSVYHTNNFYCTPNLSNPCLNMYALCDTKSNCIDQDDERFCKNNASFTQRGSICQLSYSSQRLDREQYLCEYSTAKTKKQIIYFSLDGIQNLPDDDNEDDDIQLSSELSIDTFSQRHSHCHRGLDLRLWLDSASNQSMTACLCPPSFYGDRCQYQNQRVSLSIQFRASSHSRQTPFAIIISLIDDSAERIIHSSEQLTYLSIRDCKIKFNVYLLYSTRPKDSSKTYVVQIDIYEKISLAYRGSVIMPILFSFLPVYRLASIVDMPWNEDDTGSCSIDQCVHGKCVKYVSNSQNTTFCRCHSGWSGRACTIPYPCQCSSDSLCLGITADHRSICVCPLDRFGPRCLLQNPVCSTNGSVICQNGGQCIPNDETIESDQKSTCICPKGFIGKRCEIIENKLILSFANAMTLPQSIFVHFIRVVANDRPRQATTFRSIPFKHDAIIVHWSQPFHLVFLEFTDQNFYLITIQENSTQSITINKTINPSDRCRPISELFSQTIVELHLLRRIKYYQLPCRAHSPDLQCFYDDKFLCLCQNHREQRVANCLEFDYNKTFDCLGQSVCENSAQCFQDAPNCPQRSICVCPSCYYGTRCQFTTQGFSLSLDEILGYHIQPQLTITEQPSSVQISVALTIIYMIVGLINGILATITFKNKRIRNVGCGYYLLGTSISTLFITVMFGLKFWILILAQMEVIVNRTFLNIQCHALDFLLRCLLNTNQWLNACVAIERAVTMVQGARFNKNRSKQIAKSMILIVLTVIIGTNLIDPIHRRLIDEENENEKRIWCVVSYSSALQTFNSIMNGFHFITPFLCNLISAIVLIAKKSRQKAFIQSERNYSEVLRAELRQYKHLLIAPIVLVILAVPRLIFSFASKCMKSPASLWLYLTGYFISFIPPMLTFVVYILPSKFYQKELQMTVKRYRTNVKRRLYTI